MITAQLLNDRTASALGVTGRGDRPLFALAKRLIEAGHNPTERLSLALNGQTVISTSLGEAANHASARPRSAEPVEIATNVRSATRAAFRPAPEDPADRVTP